MNSEQSEELRMLRARAFGPSSDIHDDPAALRRLSELEDLARTRREPQEAPAAAPPVVSEVDQPQAVAGEREPETPAGPEPERTQGAAEGRIRLLRLRALWAASLVTTAVIAVAVTVWLTPTISVSHATDVRYVGTVEADPSGEWPVFMGERATGSVVFEDFLGLTAITQGEEAFNPQGVRCMAVVLTEYEVDDEAYAGPSFWGCGAGSFPVRVAVVVGSGAPAQLLERFPAGSALEFVLDGDRIGVFSDAD